MQERVDPINKFLLLGALLPLCIAPLLAVQFPRVLAFLPLVTILFAAPFIFKNKAESFLSFKKAGLFLVACLVLMLLHSFFVAQYQEDAFERLVKLSIVVCGGLVFLIAMKSLPPVKEMFLRLTLWCCALGAVLISFEIVMGEPLYRLIREFDASDIVSTAVYNRGALSIVFLGMLSFFLLENKKQLVTYVSAVAAMGMLYLGQSQSAQLVFVVLLAFYFLWPSASKSGWYIVFALISLATLSAPFFVPYMFDNLPDFINEIGFFRYSYVGPRFEIWDYVSRQVYASSIWGHGLEFTKNFEGFESQKRYTDVSTVLHPHNFILQLWIEFGVLGILAFLIGLGSLMRFLYKNLSGNLRKTSFTIVMSYLFVSCFSYGMWQGWWLGLAFIMTGWIVLMINQDKQPIKS